VGTVHKEDVVTITSTTQRILSLGLVATLCFGAMACATTEPVAPSCPLPEGYDLDEAITRGLSTVRQCPDRYDAVFRRLLDIAATERSMDNRRKLNLFAKQLIDESVVPADTTRVEFERYFASEFSSIPRLGRPVAQDCRQREPLSEAVIDELRKKRVGFLEVMGDEATYNQMAETTRDFLDALEIICSTL
jgi:hypothetical protein